MRNGERVDRIFGPDWLQTEYTHGKVRATATRQSHASRSLAQFAPTDQNIPSNIKRLLPHTQMEFDPPLTAMGAREI